MKVIQKGSANVSSLKAMIGKIRSGSFSAYQIDQKADMAKAAREIEAFIGKDTKPVTVIVIKDR